jgi:transcriptional/translational regulatory protein YebC/TACO1
MEGALEMGADDVIVEDDGSCEVRTSFETFLPVKEKLVVSGLEPASAEMTFIPSMIVEMEGEKAESLLNLIDRLEDLDDVQSVYHNADIRD